MIKTLAQEIVDAVIDIASQRSAHPDFIKKSEDEVEILLTSFVEELVGEREEIKITENITWIEAGYLTQQIARNDLKDHLRQKAKGEV